MYTSLQIHRCLVKEKINEERGTSTSEHYSNLAAFVGFCFFVFFRFSSFLTYFPPWMPARQINSSLTRSQGFVKMAIFSLNHKNASY